VAKQYNERPDKLAAGKQLRLICIERDPDNYEALKSRLSGFDYATVLPGEFGEHADTIVSTIGNDRVLVLLDPIGVKSIDAATCLPRSRVVSSSSRARGRRPARSPASSRKTTASESRPSATSSARKRSSSSKPGPVARCTTSSSALPSALTSSVN